MAGFCSRYEDDIVIRLDMLEHEIEAGRIKVVDKDAGEVEFVYWPGEVFALWDTNVITRRLMFTLVRTQESTF